MIIQTQKSVQKSNGFDNTYAQYDISTCTRALSWLLHAEGFCQTLESETGWVNLEGIAAAPPMSPDNIHHYMYFVCGEMTI